MMKTEKNISAYILCGGKSSRMGSEKGLVLYQGKAFIQWVIDALRAITPKIYLVTQNMDYKIFNKPILNDKFKEKGPVGGIHTALTDTNTQWNLILSCDLPGISTSVLKHLITQATSGTSVSFLCADQKAYPLIGIYQKNTLSAFTDALESDKLCLMDVIKKLNHQAIEIPLSQKGYVNNINTKEELQLLTQNI